jgi:hypothetical protein
VTNRRLLDAVQMGTVLGLSARSVLRQFERGRIPGYRCSPKRVRFDLDEVLEALRERGSK